MLPEDIRESSFERAFQFAFRYSKLKQAWEMITENTERIKRIEQLNKEIDQALDDRDKDKFMKLSSELKQLGHHKAKGEIRGWKMY